MFRNLHVVFVSLEQQSHKDSSAGHNNQILDQQIENILYIVNIWHSQWGLFNIQQNWEQVNR